MFEMLKDPFLLPLTRSTRLKTNIPKDPCCSKREKFSSGDVEEPLTDRA